MRLLLIALLLLPSAYAAPKKGAHLVWVTTWSEAVEEARALNLPIVVHRHGFY